MNIDESDTSNGGNDGSHDLEVRAPLPPEHCSNHYETMILPTMRPLVCRMLVACRVLDLANETRFTALVLLHRYAAAFSDLQQQQQQQQTQAQMKQKKQCVDEEEEEDHWKWVAAACLVLACKTEEEPRRLRDVINVAQMLQFGKDPIGEKQNGEKMMTNNETPICKLDILDDPPKLDGSYWESKERIVATEQAVLRMIQFDVLVSHPHRVVSILAEDVSSDIKLFHVAWRRLNDALFYPKALRHPVLPLACAALCLAIEETQTNADVDGDEKNDGNDSDIASKLGLKQFWSESYKISSEMLAAAQTSLIEATASL